MRCQSFRVDTRLNPVRENVTRAKYEEPVMDSFIHIIFGNFGLTERNVGGLAFDHMELMRKIILSVLKHYAMNAVVAET